MLRVISVVGFILFVLLAYALSQNRKAVNFRTLGFGFLLQFVFALLILKTSPGQMAFGAVNNIIVAFLGYTEAGASMIFGGLVGWNVPVGTMENGAFQASNQVAQVGSFFAFTVLPTIIFFSSVMAIFFHLGIIQKVVAGLAWVMSKTMKTSGAESLSASANIFVGQTEAPLVIRPYVERMTQSELMAVMTVGFATVAGGVMAAYVAMLKGQIPGIAGHLMAASIMAAPAALAISKILVPETETPETSGDLSTPKEAGTSNIVDAAANGASDGVKLAINVGAMLIAFVAIVAAINGILGWCGGLLGFDGLSLSFIFGKVFAPLAFLTGVPWSEAAQLGDLIGTKITINEFVAFSKLVDLGASGEVSTRTMVIASYALCGFANIGSIGIQLGGIGGIAPSRRSDLAKLGPRAMLAGALASMLNACIAGLLL